VRVVYQETTAGFVIYTVMKPRIHKTRGER
jgi:hypothetical protein